MDFVNEERPSTGIVRIVNLGYFALNPKIGSISVLFVCILHNRAHNLATVLGFCIILPVIRREGSHCGIRCTIRSFQGRSHVNSADVSLLSYEVMQCNFEMRCFTFWRCCIQT